jgi:hypothetical protein
MASQESCNGVGEGDGVVSAVGLGEGIVGEGVEVAATGVVGDVGNGGGDCVTAGDGVTEVSWGGLGSTVQPDNKSNAATPNKSEK